MSLLREVSSDSSGFVLLSLSETLNYSKHCQNWQLLCLFSSLLVCQSCPFEFTFMLQNVRNHDHLVLVPFPTPDSSTKFNHLKEWCIQITGERNWQGRNTWFTISSFLSHLFESSVVNKRKFSLPPVLHALVLMVSRRSFRELLLCIIGCLEKYRLMSPSFNAWILYKTKWFFSLWNVKLTHPKATDSNFDWISGWESCFGSLPLCKS